jgi:hypothetical protein
MYILWKSGYGRNAVSGFFCLNNIPDIAPKTGGALLGIRIFPLRKPTILHIIEAWNKCRTTVG